ncbi:MAG: S1C family serine protease [Planctomycetota bacterium]|jgi:S1-C subfamily serine protease
MKYRRIIILLIAAAATTTPTAAQEQKQVNRRARRSPVVEVFEKNRDAVVNIAATQVVERVVGSNLFDELFGWPRQRRTRRYTRTSLGSGFVIHPEGYVVTNAHVVQQAVQLKIIFSDKTEYEAEQVAVDEKNDLAVLKIKDRQSFPAIKLGQSNDLMTGETVIAIGNPLGYQHTVTDGIISAINRTLAVSDDFSYKGLIQTNASINRGNSGGPLFNVLGELIGINTAIRGDAQNIGFAIPVDTLRKILPEMLLLSFNKEKRLEVGLRLNWSTPVYVTTSKGPAAEAGIEPGDELISIDGKDINHDYDYYIYLQSIKEHDRLQIECKRNGKTKKVTVKPKPIPIPDGQKLLLRKFGLYVEQLTDAQVKQYDLPTRLLITEVEEGSPADRAGFKKWLFIKRIGNYIPKKLDDIGLLLEQIEPGDPVLFQVWEIKGAMVILLEGRLVAR